MGEDEKLKERKKGTRGGRGFRQRHSPAATKHRGPTPGVEDYIYDSGAAKHAAQFTETTERLCNYFQANYKSGDDIAGALRKLEELAIIMPVAPMPVVTTDASGNMVTTAPTYADEHRYKREFDAAFTREERYRENKTKAFAVIYEHCTPSLRAQLKGCEDWTAMSDSQNAISLLRKIKGICCKFDSTRQGTRAIVAADKQIYVFFQRNDMTNDDYFEQFNALVDTAESYGSSLGMSRGLVDEELKLMGTDRSTCTGAQKAEALGKAKEKYLAMLMFDGANKERFEKMKGDMDLDFAKGQDTYPTTRNAVLRLLNSKNNTVVKKHAAPRHGTSGEDSMVFAQASDRRKCFRCQKQGHIAKDCTEAMPGQEQMHTMAEDKAGQEDASGDDDEEEAYFFGQHAPEIGSGLSRDWLLLDSQSSTDMFCNAKYLTNLRKASQPTIIHCNAGTTRCDQEGIFESRMFGAIPVKYNPHGICNVLSFKTVKKLFPISYRSEPGDGGGSAFEVHTPHGVIEFKPCSRGLHYLDLSDGDVAQIMCSQVVPTVRGNFEGFSKREVLQAIKARRLQSMVGSPGLADYAGMVREKMIEDCPVDHVDLKNAHTIFGPDLASIRGRTVRRKPERVEVRVVAVPRDFLKLHRFITLTADIMFVNGIPFLLTRSRGVQLITVEYLPRRTATIIGNKLTRVLQFYNRGGFVVQTALMDREFESVKTTCPQLPINTTAANEHVPEIERTVRTVKDRARGVYNTLPFTCGLPRLMTIELIHFIVLWLNAFPVKSGISTKFSPRELVQRHKLSAKVHCKTPFGTYCEVHDEPDPSNTMQSRTHATICMGPTGNAQGSYKFYCLKTQQRLIRRRWDELPMPRSVIRTIHRHAQADKMKKGLHFTDRNNSPYDFDNTEYDDTPEALVEEDPAPYPGIPEELPTVETTADYEGVTPAVIVPEPDRETDAAAAARNANIALGEDMLQEGPVLVEPDEESEAGEADDPEIINPPEAQIDATPVDDEMSHVETDDTEGGLLHGGADGAEVDGGEEITEEADSGSEQANYEGVRRSKRLKKKSTKLTWDERHQDNVFFQYCDEGAEDKLDEYMHSMISEEQCEVIDSCLTPIFEFIITQYAIKSATKKAGAGKDREALRHMLVEHCMTQYSLKAGLKRFGKKGEAAVSKELGQFHDMSVFVPVDARTLTREERTAALASLMFLKEKKDGSVKARACADGRKQRETTPEEEAASPTVSIESLFMTCAIEASEKRDVAVMDLPGAFLHAECNDYVIMKFVGRLAELMVLASPTTYRKYVTVNAKGEPVLFVKFQKALYGMLKSALLFYKKLLTDLVANGFTINPYDPCVVTKTINGKQMTICWHVDDLKVSHVDEKEVTKIEKWLKGLYGNVSVSRGRKHTYLGMQLEYTDEGKCLVTMEKYTGDIIDGFPEVINGTAATPAADHLFRVRNGEDAKMLPEELAGAFHRTVAQLLFLSGRARRDIQTAVAFLTTRVKSPDEDDWGKVKRVLKYLNGTRQLGLTLSLENVGIIRWYVDASFAAHDDCKGHTGAMMTLGDGAVISFSRKQRINARSSTEGELIGVYDALPSVMHARYFLEAMGYKVRENVLYQDNKSSITLERNGKTSSSKRTKHINVRYFFIKDLVDRGEVTIEHCPTKRMWADVLTKPKQGHEFFVMRAKLMGCPIDLGTSGNTRSQHASGDTSALTRIKDISSATCPDLGRSPRGCVDGHTDVHTKIPGYKGNPSVSTSSRSIARRRTTQTVVEPSRYAIMCMWAGRDLP